MSFDAQAAFAATLARYVQLAQQPGCWAYVKHRVGELEADASGLYAGLYAAWREQLLALQFRPAPGERGEWWLLPSEAERQPAPAPRRRA